MAGRCIRTCTSQTTTSESCRLRARVIDTNWLTSARFKLTAPRRGRRRWWIAAGASLTLLAIAAGFGFAGDWYVTARDLAALRQERKLLAAEVERLQAELSMENATRLELARQAAELNAQVAELKGQVKFLMARRAPGTSAE